MTNEELLAKIKAEIDRLYGEYKDKFHQCGDQYHLGLIDGLDMAERVLDSLESEHLADARKISPNDIEEAAKKYAHCPFTDDNGNFHEDAFDVNAYHDFIAGAKLQKQHDAELIEIAYNDGITIGMTKQKEQMMKDYPKWRRIKAGERLPCPAYVWTIVYDNYPDCFEGRLMPNIEGVKVGRDTWYLPVDVIHNLPKED